MISSTSIAKLENNWKIFIKDAIYFARNLCLKSYIDMYTNKAGTSQDKQEK